jgi:hypothetical protein
MKVRPAIRRALLFPWEYIPINLVQCKAQLIKKKNIVRVKLLIFHFSLAREGS